MTLLIHIIHTVFHSLMVGLMWPLKFLPPFWSLALLCFFTGVLMLWIFGRCSNQAAIKAVKKQISAQFLALRLFDDRLGVFLKTEARLLLNVLSYMRLSLVPLLVMTGPIFLLLVQLNLYYSVRPIEAGESFLVKVVTDTPSTLDQVRLQVDPGLTLETPPVRIPSEREIAWRLRANAKGRHHLRVSVGAKAEEKEVLVATGFGAVSTLRTVSASDMLFYPGEPPLQASLGVRSIKVAYPDARMDVFGWRTHWLAVFFVLTLLLALLMKGFFGVEI